MRPSSARPTPGQPVADTFSPRSDRARLLSLQDDDESEDEEDRSRNESIVKCYRRRRAVIFGLAIRVYTRAFSPAIARKTLRLQPRRPHLFMMYVRLLAGSVQSNATCVATVAPVSMH
jgi:hypothetical protein